MMGHAYLLLGCDYESSASFSEALEYYRSSIEILDNTRALLQSEDAWKIGFRDLNGCPYTGLWRTLLKTGKANEALCAAEKGRAQALVDVLKAQYGVESTVRFSCTKGNGFLCVERFSNTNSVCSS